MSVRDRNESAWLLPNDGSRTPHGLRRDMRRFDDDDDEVDLVVVGCGAGGGVLIQRLARAGWKVVELDAGSFWDPDADWASDEVGSGDGGCPSSGYRGAAATGAVERAELPDDALPFEGAAAPHLPRARSGRLPGPCRGEAGCQVAADVTGADGIVWSGTDPAELLAVLHDGIRWVQLPNAGVESWVAAGVLSLGRVVTSARGVYGHQVAEHALALVLACRRHLAAAARTDSWSNEALRGQSLVDATVVVVGSGDIGRSLLAMLAPLRCRTLAVTLRGTPVPGADLTLPADRVDEALQQADVVVLAVPSTARTVGLLDARRLGLLKPTAYVVNVGRGDLVLTDDLVEALQSGRLAGAALDVTEPEPLPDGHPLWTAPGVLITPHTANPPAMKQSSFARRVAENFARLRAGEPLVGVVDAELGY